MRPSLFTEAPYLYPYDAAMIFNKGSIQMAKGEARDGASGTTDQSPRWEGPVENRPRGYLPPKDDPDKNIDAVGENNAHPQKTKLSDALKTRDED